MSFRLLLILLLISPFVQGQYFATEKRLIRQAEESKTLPEKIASLEKLAEFYYIYRADAKADSVLHKQLNLAEESNDKQLLMNALFGSALTNKNAWSSQETFDRALAFLDKGLYHAREIKNKQFEAIAYIRRAEIQRKRGNFNDAMQDITLALSSLGNEENDSLKVVIYLETGDILLRKDQMVDAYKSYNNAFDLAYEKKYTSLQSEIYYRLAALYEKIEIDDVPKKYLLKSLELNQSENDKEGILKDYIAIARHTEKEEDAERMLAHYSSTKSEKLKYLVKRTYFSFLQVRTTNTEKTRKYLEENEDLKQSFINSGIHNYYYNIGHIYFYPRQQPDSALYYYNLAAPALLKTSGDGMKASIYKQLAETYAIAGRYDSASSYYKQALALTKELKPLATLNAQMAVLFAKMGDYKVAFEHNLLANGYKKSLDSLAEKRNLVLMELAQENSKHEQDLAELKAKALRTRNLQYIGISLATAAFFILLIFMGMFPRSRFTMKMLSFFAFICLFEFIILLIDTWLHHVTHAEPLKIWLAKIVIIAVLLPLHHYLDHLSYQFLTSHKLEKLRQQFSVKRIISRIKVAAPAEHVETPAGKVQSEDKHPVA